jgi:hypothetical protein
MIPPALPSSPGYDGQDASLAGGLVAARPVPPGFDSAAGLVTLAGKRYFAGSVLP